MNSDDILKKYEAKIEKQLGNYNSASSNSKFSSSYTKFKDAMAPEYSRYERWCKSLGNFIHLKVSEKDKEKIDKQIETAHLDLTASEVLVFAISMLFLILVGGVLIQLGVWLLFSFISFMLLFLNLLVSIFIFYYAYKTPQRLALKWRLKASSQMVPAILYIVIYMKHTSNFEKAVSFAAEHLPEPLGLDLRKIFWDVEVGKYSSIKDSVDSYLESWRDYSLEFIEAFHLIESSLYEPEEARRIAILEKSLQVILDGVYDKMLKYTHEVKSPLTNVYMLGIVLPTLALAILPLASTMLQGALKWYHILVLFNILAHFLVIYLTQDVMFKRPGGYGETSLIEKNPLYEKFRSKRPYWIAGLICFPIFLIGLIPLLWAYTPLPSWLGMSLDYSWNEVGLGFLGEAGMFGIVQTSEGIAGPFGMLSLILSLLIPLSVAMFFMISYSKKTKELIKSRNEYKDVEQQFTSSLFQLGNRLGDGVPAEIAFSKVAKSSKGTTSEGFFNLVSQNLAQLGMSLEEALFNPRRGAVVFYPSELISISMKILVESVKKGLKVAANSLMSISEYVKNIKKINDRLNDLLADIISDMKSNMTFLAPLLSGIIVGLAGMIALILGTLAGLFENVDLSAAGAGDIQSLLGIFDVTTMVPTYFLSIIIGFYLIEIIFILTSTLTTVKAGRDELYRVNQTAKNLIFAFLLYFVVALIAIVALGLIAAVALSGLAT